MGTHILTAAEARELRNKIVTEFNRRRYYGSLQTFMNTTDMQFYTDNRDAATYPKSPTSGSLIRANQGMVIIKSLLQIQDIGDLSIPGTAKGLPIQKSFNEDLITYVNNLSAQHPEMNGTSCRGACTGLCYGTCATGCNGCTSSCGGSCEGRCQITCGNSCGSCSGSCNTSCNTSCNADCKNGCTGCKTNCTTTCGNNCRGVSTS